MKLFKHHVLLFCVPFTLLTALFTSVSFSSPSFPSTLFASAQAKTIDQPRVLAGSLTSPIAGQALDQPQPESVNGTWVVRIQLNESTDVAQLADSIDVWAIERQQGYLAALVTQAEWTELVNAGYSLTIDVEQMARLVEIERIRTTVAKEVTQEVTQEITQEITQEVKNAGAENGAEAGGGIPGFSCYRLVEETYADLSKLAAANPTLAQWVDIGDSWNKVMSSGDEGYDLHAIVLTNRAITTPKPRFFIQAAVHARELVTSEVVTRFAERLVAQYGIEPDVTWLLDYAEVHIVPYGNPDGRKQAEQLIYWRKNLNLEDAACVGTPSVSSHGGVDINRNSSFQWNQCDGFSCSSSNTCSQTFRGPSPASEPETQALQEYMSSIFSDTRPISLTAAADPNTAGLMITVHSYSELIIYPWGWSKNPPPNEQALATLGRKFGYFTGYGVCQSGSQNCLYQADGLNDDWAYGELGVPAYTFELGTEFFQSCQVFENSILEDNLDAFLYGFKVARLPYQLPAGPEVTEVLLSSELISTTDVVTLTATIDDTRFDSNGPWGVEPTQVISAARYSIDAPSWISGTQLYPLIAVSGSVTSTVTTFDATINPANWAPGQHMIFVEGQDANGVWGVPSARFLTVAEQNYAAELSAKTDKIESNIGMSAIYPITLFNEGALTDRYTLTITSTWPLTLSTESVSISPGQSSLVTVTVRIPDLTNLLTTNNFSNTSTIEVFSEGTGQLLDQLQLTTVGAVYRRYFPFFVDQ